MNPVCLKHRLNHLYHQHHQHQKQHHLQVLLFQLFQLKLEQECFPPKQEFLLNPVLFHWLGFHYFLQVLFHLESQ